MIYRILHFLLLNLSYGKFIIKENYDDGTEYYSKNLFGKYFKTYKGKYIGTGSVHRISAFKNEVVVVMILNKELTYIDGTFAFYGNKNPYYYGGEFKDGFKKHPYNHRNY